MQIKLYNTMTRKVEEFKPLVPGQVSFYGCGPTVYHYAHIGNMLCFIRNDLLRRMFVENGYKVHHVMNITDVGHLTSDDDDSGEDNSHLVDPWFRDLRHRHQAEGNAGHAECRRDQQQ